MDIGECDQRGQLHMPNQEAKQAKSGDERSPTALDVFELPGWALLRATDIVGKKVGKNNKSRGPRLIPVSPSTWWEGVRIGVYPPGKKVGSMRVWTVAEIKKLAEQLAAES